MEVKVDFIVRIYVDVVGTESSEKRADDVDEFETHRKYEASRRYLEILAKHNDLRNEPFSTTKARNVIHADGQYGRRPEGWRVKTALAMAAKKGRIGWDGADAFWFNE